MNDLHTSNVLDKLKNSQKNIVIFGAGIVGRYILDICRKQDIHVMCFCDNKLADGTLVKKLVVHRLECLRGNKNEYQFIITIMDIDFIQHELNMNGFPLGISVYNLYEVKAIPAKKSFWEYHLLENVWYAHKNYEQQDQFNLKSLDVVITERCSLKCKECSNLMQYYQSPHDFSVEQIKAEISQLLQVCDEIYEVRVIGGEPFLHHDLSEILSFLGKKKKIKCVSVWTNGTIAPKEHLLQVMHHYGVWLSISNYGKLSRNLKSLLMKLDEYGINYLCKDIDYWTKCSIFSKWNRSHEDLKKVYDECCARNLTTLLKGKVYICPFIANAMNLGAIPLNKQDYVELMHGSYRKECRSRLQELLRDKNEKASCDYCIGRPVVVDDKVKIRPCEQIKEPLYFRQNPTLNE